MCSNANCLAFSLDSLVRPSILKSFLKILSSIEGLTNESKLKARQLAFEHIPTVFEFGKVNTV
jgi:hypothetical protein